MSATAQAVGIDLGATTMYVAAQEAGQFVMVENAEKDTATPAVVYLGEPEVVGAAALHRETEDRELAVGAGLLLGARFDDVQPLLTGRTRSGRRTAGRVSPEFVQGEDGMCEFLIEGRRVSPQAVAASVVGHVTGPAGITQAVFAVPAGASAAQVAAVTSAARQAGVTALDVIEAPWAAVLGHGLHLQGERTIAVLHVGGMTAQATILRVAGGKPTALATATDLQLGGVDVTQEIAEYALHHGAAQHGGVPVSEFSAKSRRRLGVQAENTKIALSRAQSVTSLVDLFHQGTDLSLELSRPKLVHLTRSIWLQLDELWHKVLDDADVPRGAVTDVILTGATTAMPWIAEKAGQVFGRTPLSDRNRAEIVAQGCAVHATLADRG